MKPKKKWVEVEALEGVPFFHEGVGEWFLVKEEELPELAKEDPQIMGEDWLNSMGPEQLEGQRIRVVVFVEGFPSKKSGAKK